MASTSPKTSAYTLSELMVAAAAREIRDGEVVFVGMRLPLIAFVVAKRTHAPGAVGLFENGVIRSTPASEMIYTMADSPNIKGATECLDMLGVMSLLQSGRVHLGFLGAAEVDRFGNLNSTQVVDRSGEGHDFSRAEREGSGEGHGFSRAERGGSGEGHDFSRAERGGSGKGHDFSRADRGGREEGALAPGEKITRLPGSGGACDIASLAHRFVALLEHSKRRLPARVSYVTSPGNGDGDGWRQRVGLPRGGPAAVITTKAVLRFDDSGEAYLASVHPGVTIEDLLANTGWELRVAKDVVQTREPTREELAVIRDYDKEGFWTK